MADSNIHIDTYQYINTCHFTDLNLSYGLAAFLFSCKRRARKGRCGTKKRYALKYSPTKRPNDFHHLAFINQAFFAKAC